MEMIPTNIRHLEQASNIPDIAHLLAEQLAESSIAMYKRDVQAYVEYALLHNLHWLDPQTLASWRDALATQSSRSPHTINRMIATYKRIVRELASREQIAETVALKFDHVRGVKVKALKKRLKQNSRTKIAPEDKRMEVTSHDYF